MNAMTTAGPGRFAAAHARRYTRRDPEAGIGWITKFVRAALWIAWIGLILRPIFADVTTVKTTARFLSELAALILCATGAYWALRVKPRDDRAKARNVALALLALLMVPAIYGLARGNSFIYWTLLGAFPFGTAILIVLGSQPRVVEVLESTLFWQVCFGLLFAIWVLVFEPPGSRVEWGGEDGNGFGKYATRTLYGMPFLLPLIHRMPQWRRWVVLAALMAYAALGVAGANRGMTILAFVILPLSFFFFSVRRRDGAWHRALVAVLVVSLCAVLAAATAGRLGSLKRYMSHRWEETFSRLTGGGDDERLGDVTRSVIDTASDEFIGERSRGGELSAFFEQLEPIDYIVGRGFGGTWYSAFWRKDWAMVHIGPAHLLLVGGVPLVIAFLLVMGLAFLHGLRWMTKSDRVAGAVLYLVVYLEGWTQHGAMQDEVEVYFAWLCVGIALSGRVVSWKSGDAVTRKRKVHWLVARRGSQRPVLNTRPVR